MNPLALALDVARHLHTATPQTVPFTERDLALALHTLSNEGRTARFGSGVCKHIDQAARVLAFLRERPQ